MLRSESQKATGERRSNLIVPFGTLPSDDVVFEVKPLESVGRSRVNDFDCVISLCEERVLLKTLMLVTHGPSSVALLDQNVSLWRGNW